MTPLLTITELAAHLRCSVRQIDRLRAAGMPAIPIGSRARVYDPAACEQWLAANPTALCPSAKTPPAAGTSNFVSAALAFTESSRRAQLRVMPRALKPSSTPR